MRRESHASPTRALTLEHYPGMTEKELARIEAEAADRWQLSADTDVNYILVAEKPR